MKKYISEKTFRRLIHYSGPCCLSCHDDNYEGLDMCWVSLGKDRYAEVCCALANYFDKWKEKEVINDTKETSE